jgi:UDP-N-acetylglucosamine diphosphorylase/glucosamine-1-phosphate N-acetyltransferase
MNTILFDPPETRENLLPLTFTRPVGSIRIGILRIHEKWERMLAAPISWLTQDYLADKYPVRIDDENLLISGGTLPDHALVEALGKLTPGTALYSAGKMLAVKLDRQGTEAFRPGDPGHYDRMDYNHQFLEVEFPWDIFGKNGEALAADFELLTRGRKSGKISSSNTLLGEGKLFLEPGARVEGATLNTAGGPVYIGANAEIMEGSNIRGSFALCDHSTLKMGAKIYGPTTIGPHSKVGGEVNNSIVFGYSNKAHDGFLGNSVIGEWCNIGADSNNSNLKNNYATVRVWNYREEKFISTGLTFCGLIMGDHSKCGINTMFNTGTVVGVNANIFGSGFPRNFIPSFSWGGAHGFTTYQLNKAYEVAVEVMKRRGIEFDGTEQSILAEVFRLTGKYRS